MGSAPTHTGTTFLPIQACDEDDWASHDEDEAFTPIDAGEQVLISPPPPLSPLRPNAPPNSVISRRSTSKTISRRSSSKIRRLKSRQRQKAQNAKAGIKVITDMSTFRRQQQKENHIVHHMRAPDNKPVKFVDAAALRALEGEPSSASVGNWNWLRKHKDKPLDPAPFKSATERTPEELSPEDRPIPIGIALPSGEIVKVTPQTAHIDDLSTPVDPLPPSNLRLVAPTQSGDSHQPKSVWSPDTPDTAISFTSARPTSSIYSQATAFRSSAPHLQEDVPPVPALPANYKKSHHHKLISLEISGNHTPVDEEHNTPATLFEEDGNLSPIRRAKSHRSIPNSAVTPDSALSRSRGWWDHVITPFTDRRFTFASRSQHLPSPRDRKVSDIWGLSQTERHQQIDSPTTPLLAEALDEGFHTPPPAAMEGQSHSEDGGFRDHSTTRRHSEEEQEGHHREKSDALFNTADCSHNEELPPYSPPKRNHGDPVRFRAVFPPGHPLQAQFPPTPVVNPGSPGLANTMTSQGATQMTEIPLTPAGHGPVNRDQPLPIRPVGTSLPQEHAHEARGDRHRVERRRRRYEKEEMAARKAGSFWRGRGCIPKKGCFGRTGREGRKKRRCCCFLCCLIMGLLILIIVLSVVLTRPHHHGPEHSIWVNLTDYPPMPTGVLTFVGPDNTISRSSCTEPNTLWSCSLPKDDHTSVKPYQPDQPTVIFQIQWDNATQKSWDVPNPGAPDAVSKRSGGAAFAGSVVRASSSSSVDGFTSNPLPPAYDEMWFLGETTDGIKADQKAGEATPFFISLLKSANDTVNSPNLSRRGDDKDKNDDGGPFNNTQLSDLLPRPDLLSDGTPAPAVMLPTPVQQPVRLFDRGLRTEHYGFYSYFSRTIYLKSVTVLNGTTEGDGDVPIDENGGCSKTEADFLTTWSQTRFLVQIWTRLLNESKSSILKSDNSSGGSDGSPQLVRPGSMPYPVTVTLDTHGGEPKDKFVWEWPMDDRQQLDLKDPKLLSNDISVGGKLINPRNSGDTKYGGFDGGDGGCKCEWVNWV